MFAKMKQTVLRKAFDYAFSRYDSDKSSFLDREELTSLLNDTFELIGYPHKVSWIEAKVAMKMFDDNGDKMISKDQAYGVAKTILTSGVGVLGFGGDEKSSNKVGGALPPSPYDDYDEQNIKIGGAVQIDVPEDDAALEQKMQNLPPPGKNITQKDEQKKQQDGFLL